jgi:hypothetical protein
VIKLRISSTLRFSHFFITYHPSHPWYLLTDSIDTRTVETVELVSTLVLISEVNDSLRNCAGLVFYDWPVFHPLSIVESSFQRTYWLIGTVYYQWQLGISEYISNVLPLQTLWSRTQNLDTLTIRNNCTLQPMSEKIISVKVEFPE